MHRGGAAQKVGLMRMITKDFVLSRNEDAAGRIVDGEAVVLTLADAEVNVMNSVGTRIWELVDGTRTVGDIAAVISAEFEVSTEEALADAGEFLAELADKKMLDISVAEGEG